MTIGESLGGGVAEWLGCWTCNPEFLGSSFLSDHLDLFHGSPVFKSSATLVNKQVVPTSWGFQKHLCSIFYDTFSY